jgi:hypothetical protein
VTLKNSAGRFSVLEAFSNHAQCKGLHAGHRFIHDPARSTARLAERQTLATPWGRIAYAQKSMTGSGLDRKLRTWRFTQCWVTWSSAAQGGMYAPSFGGKFGEV